VSEYGIKLHEGNAAADRFRDFSENFPGAVFIYDVKPDGSDILEYVSRKCVDIWEISPEEALENAKPIWDLIVTDDVPVMSASIQKSAKDMSGWHCRWRIVTKKSKQVKWLEGWGQPRKLVDGTIRWNSMILDVTRQRNAEQALEASRDRALGVRHLETMGTLSSGIAHDFNNLLTVVAGNLDLLRMKLGNEKQFEPILESLSRAVYRGSSLARNLLSFSRRHQSLEESIELHKFSDQFADLCRRTLSARLQLSSVYDAPGLSITIDVGLLQNSLLNLVLNSRDAVKEDGKVEVKYEVNEATDELLISVSDNGSGMSDDVKKHLFQPFFTTKPMGKGTGLGLNLVNTFAEQYGGTVSVESSVGLGTKMMIRLPLARLKVSRINQNRLSEAVDEGFSQTNISPEEKNAPIVLVVEDDPDIRSLIMEVLKIHRFQTISAANGDEAFAIIQSNQAIDLVLSDVMMPGKLLGTDLVKLARHIRPSLPMILMSGYVDSSRGSPLDVLSKFPDVMLLQKPMRPDEILIAIKNSLPK
jgi:signal transduction histidine kinase/CheY-like chemotaxis protein